MKEDLRVVLAGERIVAHERRRIGGLGQRAQHCKVNGARGLALSSGLQQRLQIAAGWFFRQAEFGNSRKRSQRFHVAKCWLRMDAAQER